MIKFSKKIDKSARQVCLALRLPDNSYFNIFTLIECINSNMQDYDAFTPNCGNNLYCQRDDKADGKSPKVYIGVEKFNLRKELLYEPWNCTKVGNNHVSNVACDFEWISDNSLIIPADADINNEITALLPKRGTTAYVRYCLPHDNSFIAEKLADPKVASQLKELSLNNLGYDITCHSKFFGGYMLVCYNDIYSSVDIKEDSSAPGVFCRTNYREGCRIPLTFRFRNYAKDGNVIQEYTFKNHGRFLNHFHFNEAIHSTELSIYDVDDYLVDFIPKRTFIHSIQFNTRVLSKQLHVTDGSRTLKVVDKYVDAGTSIIGKKNVPSLFGTSPQYSYERFEKSLDFVFFDGDKNREKKNVDKARDCVRRILNSANGKCYICDIFFHAVTLHDFVMNVENQDVEIRILTSKEKLQPNQIATLGKEIERYKNQEIANVYCRVFKGNSTLHDRLIIADDNVWMLGCSLNEFGVRATTLIRVPYGYADKIIRQVEDWWTDNTISEEI